MKFKIISQINIRDIFVKEIFKILNDQFKGWVFIKSEDESTDVICHVLEYNFDGKFKWNSLNCGFDKVVSHIVALDDVKNGVDFEIREHDDYVPIYNKDIVYKLDISEEDDLKPKIRWWKDGKLENIKTFEQFNNDIDPYGEEDWDEQKKVYDLSEEDSDEQIEQLRNLIIKYGPNVSFRYSSFNISDEEGTEDNVPQHTVWEIEDVYRDEDGNIILIGTILKYIKEEWIDLYIFYTLDTTFPVILTDIEIKL